MNKTKVKLMKSNDKSATVMLSNVRLAFVSLAEPNTRFSTPDSDGVIRNASYEVTCLISKDFDMVEALKPVLAQLLESSTVFTTAVERKQQLGASLKVGADGALIKDGDKTVNAEGKVYEGFEGNYTLKAKSGATRREAGETFQPKVSFRLCYWNLEPIKAEDIRAELYAGVYADVVINLFPYKFGNQKGVTAYLVGVQKLKDGDKIGGFNPFGVREDVGGKLQAKAFTEPNGSNPKSLAADTY